MRKTAMVLLSVIIIISAALSAVISVKASNEDLVEIKDGLWTLRLAVEIFTWNYGMKNMLD